jgi:DnaK suppressor protein
VFVEFSGGCQPVFAYQVVDDGDSVGSGEMQESQMGTDLAVERAMGQARLRAAISEFDEIVEAGVDSNGDDEHDPEGSTVAFERARAGALLTAARVAVDNLDRASARFDDGTYGWCRICGARIGSARLAALPAVETCVGCVGGPHARSGSNHSLIQGVTTRPWRIPQRKTPRPTTPQLTLRP